MKRVTAVLLALIMILSSAGMVSAEMVAWNTREYNRVEAAMHDTAKYIVENVTAPAIGSIGGEWSIIGLSASGYPVPKAYYDGYYKRVEASLKENQGILTKNKYTEYSRLIIALTAIGKDVKNVAGYNLLEKLADFDSIQKQGINGPVYALIALDCHDYEIPKVAGIANVTTRQGLIDYIIAQEITNVNGVKGGFDLGGGTVPDADITGMALQALSNYQDNPAVMAVINRGIKALTTLENVDGTYSSWGVETSESIVQVIVAKAALGIDASENIEGLLKYYRLGNGFEHVFEQGQNMLATEQSLYAMAAYKLGVTENRSLYNLNHIRINSTNTNNYDANQIHIVLNGMQLEFDQAPIIVAGRTLVPMRAVFEALGAKVTWNDTLKEATGTLGEKTVLLRIGSKTAYVNGVAMGLDVPAQIVSSRTLMPIRFVAESLDAVVDWDPITRTVYIEKKEQ